MIMKEYISQTFNVKPSNVHFTIIYCIGIIVQGIYQQLFYKLDICDFLVYLTLTFLSSLMYYKTFHTD